MSAVREGGDLSSAEFCGQGRRVLQMRTSTLFGAKNFGFFEIYGMSARIGGVRQSGHFSNKEEVAIFRDFVRICTILFLETKFFSIFSEI